MEHIRNNLLALILALVCLLNIAFQEQLADILNPEWRDQLSSTSETIVTNPLAENIEAWQKKGIELSMPKEVEYHDKNLPANYSLLSMLPADVFNRKLDVLLIGDSTLAWGFDYQQIEHQAGMRAASIAYGLNVPDRHLALFARILANCIVADTGIIILSYSSRTVGTKRLTQAMDKELIRLTDELKNCEDLDNALKSTSKLHESWFWNRAVYDRKVTSPVTLWATRMFPLWSAQIGWKSYFPNPDESGHTQFLVWNNSFKVPLTDRPHHWSYRPFTLEGVEQSATELSMENWTRYREIAISNLAGWEKGFMGRTVCHVLPPTSVNEDWRFILWRDWTQSRCLLDYGTIIHEQLNIDKLEVIDNHHYVQESGLLMAAALGKLLKTHLPLDTEELIPGEIQESNGIFLRQVSSE